jgi:lysophospholipase L1-like esterase
MANITLAGILKDSIGQIDVGAIVTFTHLTTTGETIKGTSNNLVVAPDGAYSINLQYGQIRIDYTTRFTERFVAIVVVNSDSTATNLPDLLNAAVPPTNAQLLQFQAILADAVTAKNAAEAAADAVDTFANLIALTPTITGTPFTCQERSNASYILQASGYVALSGDATFANGRVAARQYLPIFTPESLGFDVTGTTDVTLDSLNKSPFSIIDNYRQFNFHKSGSVVGDHAVAIPDNLFRITEASRSIDRPINACNKVLFVGDSLTAYLASDGSYTEKVARTLMSEKGGIREVGYVAAEPVTISAKQQFIGMSITQSGFSYLSDGTIAYSDDRRRFSPDGKGATIAGADGSQSYYWNTTSATLVRYTKYRLYYLQQVGGGTFNLRNRGATLNAIDTDGTLGLQTVEFDFVDNGNALNKDIRVEDVTGNITIYGVELIDELSTSGFTYDVAAIAGGALSELIALDTSGITTLATNRAYDTVVINLGTNDSTQGRTTTQFIADLTAYKARLVAALPNVSVVIVTPNNMQFTNFTGSTRALYEDARRAYARANNLMYIDLPSEVGNFNYLYSLGYMRDGTHPNILGQDRIGILIADKLASNLQDSKTLVPDVTYITNIQTTCTGTFDANGGVITTQFLNGCTITFISTGLYQVTFTDDVLDAFYTVAVENGAANRFSGEASKVVGGFRISYIVSSTGAAIDIASGSPISFTVFARVKQRVY